MQHPSDDNKYLQIQPEGEIRKYIKTVWYSNLEQRELIKADYLPKLSVFCSLILNGKATVQFQDESPFPSSIFAVNGFIRNQSAHLEFSPFFESIGIEFTPIGASAFFKESPSTFENHSFSMEDIAGVDVDYLVNKINAIKTIPRKLTFLLNYLSHRITICQEQEKFINFVLQKIDNSGGNIRINELSEACFMTEKTFKRRFSNLIGTTPKNYNKLVRFHSVLNLLTASTFSLEEISFKTGYFDTSHLTRDFRTISNLSPIKLISSRTQLISSIWGE